MWFEDGGVGLMQEPCECRLIIQILTFTCFVATVTCTWCHWLTGSFLLSTNICLLVSPPRTAAVMTSTSRRSIAPSTTGEHPYKLSCSLSCPMFHEVNIHLISPHLPPCGQQLPVCIEIIDSLPPILLYIHNHLHLHK